MAVCGMVSTTSSSYGIHQASLIRIPSTSNLGPSDPSPTAFVSNGTMGSTSSLLADSGYRGGSSHYSGGSSHSYTNSDATTSNSSVFEEHSSSFNDDTESVGPPKLTPISGKLEKTKEKKLIKPIAVRFASPNASPNTSPTDTFKHSAQSPSLSDTMATYAHPPDILMTSQNNNHGFSAGKHFGRPPTKAMSLQDITPQHTLHNNNYHNSGHHQSTLPHNKESASSFAKQRQQKLNSAQSLNFLNRGGWHNYLSGTISGKTGRGRSHSQTNYVGDEHSNQYDNNRINGQSNPVHLNSRMNGQANPTSPPYSRINRSSNPMSPSSRINGKSNPMSPTSRINGQSNPMSPTSRINGQSNPMSPTSRINSQSNPMSPTSRINGQNDPRSPKPADDERIYSPVAASAARDEANLAEENRILRNKVQDMKQQLVTMRDTMEVNEQTIFQVHQEKRRDFEANISRLQTELNQQKDSAQSQQRSHQQDVHKLEQERKHLRTRLEEMQKEILRLKDHGKKVDEQKTVLAENQQEISNKRCEIKKLEDSLKRSNDELHYERETVKRLQAELDKARMQLSKRLSSSDQQQLLSKKDAELAQARADGKKAVDQRDSLMLRVKKQGEEIDRLGALLKIKERELAQEKCEIAYLKEVNERMTSSLREKEGKVEPMKTSVEGSPGSAGSGTEVIELELGRTVEKLQQLQMEKDMESNRMLKRIAEKDSEIKRLQARLRDRGKASERNVGDQKANPSIKRLEQDKLDIQARLGKKEHELKQARNQIMMLQSQIGHTGPALSNSILQKKESELKSCQEKLHQRNAEITYIRDKLGERDAELTALKVKLDRVQRQHPENGRRSGSLDRELSGTRAAKHQLESQVKSLQEENSRLKDRLGKVALGVKTLSESHMNIAKLSMVPSIPDRPKFERTDPKLAGQLQKEVSDLKKEIGCLKEERDQQLAEFRQEYTVWQEEKQRVIMYQKQLQVNYMQMCQKNKKLEQEVEQLTKELDTEEVIQC